MRTVHPAWGLNPRGYRRDFGTSRLDWMAQRSAAGVLPSADITWELVRSTGEIDYGRAVAALRVPLQLDRRPLVLRHVSGMAGGYLGVRRAREFLLSRVLAPSHVAEDLGRVSSAWGGPEVVRVAVHVREGDFDRGSTGPRPGQFNRAVPVDWYVKACRSLRDQLGSTVSFLVLTDGERVAHRLREEVGAVVPPARQRQLLSDVAAMAVADLLVCSVSSLSMLGAFLSTAPYLWYAPHLECSDGWRSIWGMEAEQRAGVTALNRSLASAAGDAPLHRGVAVEDDGAVPVDLVRRLADSVERRAPRHDLLLYGVIR